jgi:hypothetical protein
MDVLDHIGCSESYGHIEVCRKVIQKLFCFGHCIHGSPCLFACNGAKCHEDGDVDRMCVIQNASDYSLFFLDLDV